MGIIRSFKYLINIGKYFISTNVLCKSIWHNRQMGMLLAKHCRPARAGSGQKESHQQINTVLQFSS
jgi:hypothetical protein